MSKVTISHRVWRLATVILAITLLTVSILAVYASSQYTSPSLRLNSTGASYSYLIETDGQGWYRAISGTTGAVAYSGTNAATVIQATLNGLTAGRTWSETVVLTGSFSISATITISSYTVLSMYDAKLTLTANTDMFKINDLSQWVVLQGGFLFGNNALSGGSLTTGNAITDGGTVYYPTVKDMRIEFFPENGIKGGAWRIAWIEHVRIYYNGGHGMYFINDIDNSVWKDNVISRCGGDGVRVVTGVLLTDYGSLLSSNYGYGLWFGGSQSSFIGTRVEDNTLGNFYVNQNFNRFVGVRCRVEGSTDIPITNRDYEEWTAGGGVYPNMLVGCDFRGSKYGVDLKPQSTIDASTRIWANYTGAWVRYFSENTVFNVANTTATTFVFNHNLSIYSNIAHEVECSFDMAISYTWTWTSSGSQITVTITPASGVTLPASMHILSCHYRAVAI